MATLGLLLAAVLSAPASAASGAAVAAAGLEYASGPVTVEDKGGPHKAVVNEPLRYGDSVVTGAGATAVLRLIDGSRLKLKESSRLKLTSPSAGVVEAVLGLGGVFAKVAKQPLGQGFRVRAASAVAAVRGTRFFTAYGRDAKGGKDLWVCVDEGLVDVGTTASKKDLPVPAGKGVLIKSGLDLTKPQAYDWTKKLNWNMDPAAGAVEDKTELDAAYADLLDQDYR